MNNVILFEGYDGSGKSTLITAFREMNANKRITVVGRKDEPSLRELSLLIERGSPRLSNQAEILARFALEFERMQLIKSASGDNDLVLVDRTFLSVRSWSNYYGVNGPQYDILANEMIAALSGATLVVCHCPFAVCWHRIEARPIKSRKEAMGVDENVHFYRMFYENCLVYERSQNGLIWVNIRTDVSVRESISCLEKCFS